MEIKNIIKETRVFVSYENKNYCRYEINGIFVWRCEGNGIEKYGYFEIDDKNQENILEYSLKQKLRKDKFKILIK